MRQLLFAVASLLGWTLAGAAQAMPILLQATLSGDQEVPPVATAASGTATLELNAAQDRLEIMIQLFGLDLDGNQTADTTDNVLAAHIHAGPPGVNGGIVFGFIGPNSDTNGDLVIDAAAGTIFSAWDLTEGLNTTLAAQLPALLDGSLYLNVHTPDHPGGEVRGQIQVPLPASAALLALALAVLGLTRTRGRRQV